MVFETVTPENFRLWLAILETAFNSYRHWIRTEILPPVMVRVDPFLQPLHSQLNRPLNFHIHLNSMLSPYFGSLKPMWGRLLRTIRFVLQILAILAYLTFWIVLGVLCVPSRRLTSSEAPGVAIFTAAALYGFYTFLPVLPCYISKLTSLTVTAVPRTITFFSMLAWVPILWIATNFKAGLDWLISAPMSLYNTLPSTRSIPAMLPTPEDICASLSRVTSSVLTAVEQAPSAEEVISALTPSNLVSLLIRMPRLTATACRSICSFVFTQLLSTIQYTSSGLTSAWHSTCATALLICSSKIQNLTSAWALITWVLGSVSTWASTLFYQVCMLGPQIQIAFTQGLSWCRSILSDTAIACYALMHCLIQFLHKTRIAVGQDQPWYSPRLFDILVASTSFILGFACMFYFSRTYRRLVCGILRLLVSSQVCCLGAAIVLIDSLERRLYSLSKRIAPGFADSRGTDGNNNGIRADENMETSAGDEREPDASYLTATSATQGQFSTNTVDMQPCRWAVQWSIIRGVPASNDNSHNRVVQSAIALPADTCFVFVVRSPRNVFLDAWQWVLDTLSKGKGLYQHLIHVILDSVDPFDEIRTWFTLNFYMDTFKEGSHYNVYTDAHVREMLDRIATTLVTKPAGEPWIGIDLKGKKLERDGQTYYMVIRDYDRQDTYLIDLRRLGKQAFSTSGSDHRTLTEILENENIQKLVFKVEPLSNTLACDFGIHLYGVIDLQIMQAMTGPTNPELWADFDHVVDCQTQHDPGWSRGASPTDRPSFDGNYSSFRERPLPEGLKQYCISDVSFFRDLFDAKLWMPYGNNLPNLISRSNLQATKAYDDTWDATKVIIDDDLIRTLREDQPSTPTVLSPAANEALNGENRAAGAAARRQSATTSEHAGMESTSVPTPDSPAQDTSADESTFTA